MKPRTQPPELLCHGVSRAVLESPGRYHRRLHQCLCAAGIATEVLSDLLAARRKLVEQRAAIIRSVLGLGPVNAACLCAQMPELGQRDRRQAAALLSVVAPFDRDSGQRYGRRSIRGGRA